MSSLHPRFRLLLAGAALAALAPLTACDQSPQAQGSYSGMPDLPATLPLALGDAGPPVYAPAVARLPAAAPIRTVRVADDDDHYAYAENAWGYVDALGDAPPDYGFYYDDVEPWAWQGYDDSLVFVEPLDAGYRYYFYRAGYDEPYFIRDPDCGYGFDDGRLAVVYGPHGEIIPYWDYGPRLDHASRYYVRGVDLYRASHRRHPVIVANWIDRHDSLIWAREDWAHERTGQRDWLAYHNRVAERQDLYWRDETVRRQADSVRFAAWQDRGFRSAPPPRAIPAAWRRAAWARDERLYAPPVRGFDGDAVMRTRAELAERQRVAGMRQVRPDERRAGRADRRGLGEQAAFAPAERARARTQEIRERQAKRPDRARDTLARTALRDDRAARIEQRRQVRSEAGPRLQRQRNEAVRPATREAQARTTEQRRARSETGAPNQAIRREAPRAARREAQAQRVEQRRQQRPAIVEQRRVPRAEPAPRVQAMRSEARAPSRVVQAPAEQRRQPVARQRQAERIQSVRSPQAEAPRSARQEVRAQAEQRQQARQAAVQQRQPERQQARQAPVERRPQRTAPAQTQPTPADAAQASASAREKRERRQR